MAQSILNQSHRKLPLIFSPPMPQANINVGYSTDPQYAAPPPVYVQPAAPMYSQPTPVYATQAMYAAQPPQMVVGVHQPQVVLVGVSSSLTLV